MKKFISLTLVFATLIAANASTLTNTFFRGNGLKYYGPVSFKPMSTPLVGTLELIVGEAFVVQTTTNGLFSGDFKPGIYEMKTSTPDRAVYIDVPNDTNTYALVDRITNNVAWSGSGIPSTIAWSDALALKANIASPLLSGTTTVSNIFRIVNGGVPGGAPASGFYMWSSNNILRVIGASGTITVIAQP